MVPAVLPVEALCFNPPLGSLAEVDGSGEPLEFIRVEGAEMRALLLEVEATDRSEVRPRVEGGASSWSFMGFCANVY